MKWGLNPFVDTLRKREAQTRRHGPNMEVEMEREWSDVPDVKLWVAKSKINPGFLILSVFLYLFGHGSYYCSNQGLSEKCFSFFKTIDFLEIASKHLKTISKALAGTQKFWYRGTCSLLLASFSWSGCPLCTLCFCSPVLIELLQYVRRGTIHIPYTARGTIWKMCTGQSAFI